MKLFWVVYALVRTSLKCFPRRRFDEGDKAWGLEGFGLRMSGFDVRMTWAL